MSGPASASVRALSRDDLLRWFQQVHGGREELPALDDEPDRRRSLHQDELPVQDVVGGTGSSKLPSCRIGTEIPASVIPQAGRILRTPE